MKKIFSGLLMATVMIAGLISCNGGGSGEAYTLKMRLAPGDKFKQDMQMKMNMNTKFMGMDKDVKMNMDIGTDFEVLPGDSANGKTLKITYTNMSTKMDMGMPGVNTDSMLNAQNKSIIGKSVIVKIDNSNQITDVSGFQELVTDSSGSEAVNDAMKKMVSKDNLNSMFGMMLRMYPAKPVKIGESWDGNTTMEMGGLNMGVKIKYTLVSVKDGIAEIGVNGTIDGKGKMGEGQSGVEMSMKGSQKGTMNVRLETGYLVKGNYKMDVTAEMEAMGQKIPMTMKGDVDMIGK